MIHWRWPIRRSVRSDVIAMFEVMVQDDEVKVVQEKHYKLVSSSDITAEELLQYRG